MALNLQGALLNLALRIPISWVNILAGPPMTTDGRTLDRHTQWFLKLLARSGQEQFHELGVVKARALMDAMQPIMSGAPAAVGRVVDCSVDGPTGRLRVRLYRPTSTVAHLLPTILYFHGGGYMLGSLECYDLICRYFCAQSGCAVVAVDYRLAPEHKFPAAIEDGVTAFRWLSNNSLRLGLDPARIVVAGDSAGGTIATVLARMMRCAPRPPCLQWLIYPVIDVESALDASSREGLLFSRADGEWFRDNYLNDPSEADDPRVSPLRAIDLTDLPPALVFTAGFDQLRDEGRAYADRLAAAGVKTVYREFESLIHGFVGMRGSLHAAAQAIDDMVATLNLELARLGPR